MEQWALDKGGEAHVPAEIIFILVGKKSNPCLLLSRLTNQPWFGFPTGLGLRRGRFGAALAGPEGGVHAVQGVPGGGQAAQRLRPLKRPGDPVASATDPSPKCPQDGCCVPVFAGVPWAGNCLPLSETFGIANPQTPNSPFTTEACTSHCPASAPWWLPGRTGWLASGVAQVVPSLVLADLTYFTLGSAWLFPVVMGGWGSSHQPHSSDAILIKNPHATKRPLRSNNCAARGTST